MGRIHYKPVARASDFPWTTMVAQQGADVVWMWGQKDWVEKRVEPTFQLINLRLYVSTK